MHRPCTRDFHLSLQGYDAYDGSSGCYIDDVTTFYVAPHFDPASLTPDMCKDGCASLGAEFTLAGITQGNVCLCGKDDSGEWHKGCVIYMGWFSDYKKIGVSYV